MEWFWFPVYRIRAVYKQRMQRYIYIYTECDYKFIGFEWPSPLLTQHVEERSDVWPQQEILSVQRMLWLTLSWEKSHEEGWEKSGGRNYDFKNMHICFLMSLKYEASVSSQLSVMLSIKTENWSLQSAWQPHSDDCCRPRNSPAHLLL